jgi:hypothetical protein
MEMTGGVAELEEGSNRAAEVPGLNPFGSISDLGKLI